MATRTQTLTDVRVLPAPTQQTVEDVAVFLRTDCSSLLKGQAPLTRTHAHGVNARRHSLWVNVSAAILAVEALIIFIYAFSNTEGRGWGWGGGREGEMREAWIQLLLCIHSPTSSWIPVAGVRDAGVFLCKFRSRICVFVVDAYAHQRITSIK